MQIVYEVLLQEKRAFTGTFLNEFYEVSTSLPERLHRLINSRHFAEKNDLLQMLGLHNHDDQEFGKYHP